MKNIGCFFVILIMLIGGVYFTYKPQVKTKTKSKIKKNIKKSKKKFTLDDFKKLVPACGKPIITFDKNNKLDEVALSLISNRLLKSISHLKQWGTAMTMATGDSISIPKSYSSGHALVMMLNSIKTYRTQKKINGIEFCHLICMKMSIMFDKAKFNSNISQRLISRLKTIPREDLAKWQKGISECIGEKINKPYVALLILPIDNFYKSNRYNKSLTQNYTSRLKSLAKHNMSISKWILTNKSFHDCPCESAIAIALIDEFFTKNKFDDSKFQAILSSDN